VLLLLDGRWEPVNLLWDLRTRITQNPHELSGERLLVRFASEEGDGATGLAGSACTTASVDKVL
jgi:hypothetical protein